MRIFALLCLFLSTAVVPAHASGIRCTPPTVTTFLSAPTWYENLEFDRGTIWLSNLTGNRIEQYSLTGKLLQTHELRAPGAIRIPFTD